jgi:Domain of unknown function (DUF4111)
LLPALRSKDAAADWALASIPEEHAAVLACARATYSRHEDQQWEVIMSQVWPRAHYVVGEIARLTEVCSRFRRE